MKFSIKDSFSKYDQIRSFLRIWSHLLKKSLMENFHFFVNPVNPIIYLSLLQNIHIRLILVCNNQIGNKGMHSLYMNSVFFFKSSWIVKLRIIINRKCSIKIYPLQLLIQSFRNRFLPNLRFIRLYFQSGH